MSSIRDIYIARSLGGGGGGGDSAYELIHSEEIEVSTTSTSATTVKTLSLGAEAFTADKLLLIRIRDKAGMRAGYVYGCDSLYFNHQAAQGASSAYTPIYVTLYASAAGSPYSMTGSLGLYGEKISSNGNVDLKSKYNSTYGTVDGTYKVEVYLVSTANGKPLFPTE